MTRKEEILKKACEFVDKRYQDVGILTTHEASVAACQDMVEWADEHPRKGLVDIERVKDFLSSVALNFYREWEDKFNTDELIVDLERYLEK